MGAAMIPVFRAGKQLLKVRAIMFMSIVCLVLALWYGVELARTSGTKDDYAPLSHRLGLAALVASLGITFAGGMWLYGRLYAASIEYDPDRQQIQLDTVGFFTNKRQVIDLTDVGKVRSHPNPTRGIVGNILEDLRIMVTIFGQAQLPNAPWKSVRILGWRLPLIIDEQGVVLHYNL